jgi:hypothetical protein
MPVKRGFTGFLALFLILGVLADARGSKGPLLRLSTRVVDFGRVDQNQQVKQDIVIRNEGDAPLKILKVVAACGCTAAIPSDSLVAPGEEATVAITFSTRQYKGLQEKKVTLYTNDPGEPTVALVVRADIHPLVRVSEDRIRFPVARRGETPVQRIRFAADKGLGFAFDGMEGGEKLFTASSSPESPAEEDAFWLELKLRADAPAGSFRQPVQVRTKVGGRTISHRVFVTGTVMSYFAITGEGKIAIPPTTMGKKAEGSIRITGDGTKPYKLLAAESDSPFLEPTVVPAGPDAYLLKVVLTELAPLGRVVELVKVRTNDPLQPEIEITVTANVTKG